VSPSPRKRGEGSRAEPPTISVEKIALGELRRPSIMYHEFGASMIRGDSSA
jgi:hypothetical protein